MARDIIYIATIVKNAFIVSICSQFMYIVSNTFKFLTIYCIVDNLLQYKLQKKIE